MPLYRVTRRWYTVQEVRASSEQDAIDKAKDEVVEGVEFYEEDSEVERLPNKRKEAACQSP